MFKPRVKKFLSYYRPYLRLFSLLMSCAFLVAAITIALPICIRYITKTVLENPGPDALTQIIGMGGVMVALLLVQTAANFFVDYRGHAMGALMERDLRAELFDHYQKLSFRFYDEHKTGQLMSRITNDLFNMAELYHHGPEDIMISVVRFGGAFAVLATINLQLTLIIFLFLPPLAIFAWHFNQRIHAALKRMRERTGDVNAQVEDTLGGIRVVKSFANEETERAKFARENERFLEARKHGYKNEAYFSEGVDLLTQLISVALVVFGGIGILNARLDLADLITFLLYVGYLIEPIRKFLHFAGQFQEGVTGFERFMEIIEIEPELQDAPGAITLTTVRGEIEFRGVGFRYQEHHAHVLRDISLRVKAGEYIALVGSSGVGKTTLCSLIPRFYEVSQGAILLDGVNIKEIRLSALRQAVGVVQQDVYLFAGTVYENIRYGKPGATRAEIIAAAKRANAHDFILTLPDGYDTDIGQRGVKLSGGQKQRLSIARVFLKDPPLLIFDEATSSLDNESEKVVQESLEALARNRTTFVIAHRLSTIRSARRILVLTDKGVEEEGTHAELIAREGTYARLYNLQFSMNGAAPG